MARLLRAWRSWRAFNSINCPQHHPSPSPPTTTSTSSSSSSSSSLSLHRFYGQRTRHPFEFNIHPKTHEVLRQNPTAELPRFCSMLPAVLAGVLGIGILEMSHADANTADSQNRSASQSPSNFIGMSGIVSHERQRLEELLRNRGMQPGSYPPFTIAVKGQQVTIKFRIPPKCELSHLIVALASRLGHKAEEHGGSSEMIIRAWDSAVAWQLTLTTPTKSTESGKVLESHEDRDKLEGSLYILLFKSLIDSDSAEIEFIKQGSFSFEELDTLVSALKLASERSDSSTASEKRPRRYSERRESRPNSAPIPSGEKSLDALEAMGVKIFGLSEPFPVPSNGVISWDSIAGYDQQKREIEDTILLALHSPEVYDDIARGTRCKFESNRPRAVLFEGPPGTGKTSCARVIANHAGMPLLYVPLEVVMSKYYGESERLLGTIFSLANELSGGAIIFLDEVDSFAIARDNEMHEATRRILSVLLRQIDGFEQEKRVVVIAATNRKQDLDPALISRFDSIITFGLPDQQTREKIAAQYAKHLKESELVQFATVTEGMSGRDIRDICQQAERRWASKIIRGEAVPSDYEHGYLPPIQHYIENSEHRQKSLLDIANDINRKSRSKLTKKPLAFA